MWIWIVISLLILGLAFLLYYSAAIIEGEETFLIVAGVFLAIIVIASLLAYKFIDFTPGKARLRSIMTDGPMKLNNQRE